MNFFNPFRKNTRPQGVKLAELSVEPAAQEGAPRKEPGFGPAGESAAPMHVEPTLGDVQASSPAAPAASAAGEASDLPAADGVPPAFTFSEPAAVESPASAAPAAPVAPAASAPKKPAPWDPYGIQPPAGEAVKPASVPTPAAPESAPQPAAAAAAAPLPPAEPAPIPAETAPVFAPAPETQSPAAAEAASAAATPEEPRPIPVVTEPMPRPAKSAAAPEVRRVPSDAELEARRRTKHRLVGAAAILMAVVVAAPFILDSRPPIDDAKLSQVRMDIPKESETSTAINAAVEPPSQRAQSGDVDVTNMTLGRDESTAKANLAREAQSSMKAQAKTEAKPQPKPAAKADAKPQGKTEAKTEAKAEPKAEVKRASQKTAGITPPTGKGWYVQVTALSNEAAAERIVKRLAVLGLPAYKTKTDGALWKVRVGLYGSRDEAEGAKGTIILNGVAHKPYVANK